MVSGLTSPDKSRFIKELDNKINENNDIIYYSTPSISPSIPSNSNSSGFGSTVTSNIDGSFGFRTETEYVGLQVDFTGGSGELKVDDTITGNGGWEGFMDSIIDGNSTTGSLFMLYKSGTFDVASTQTLTSSSGWSATYTANTAKTNAIYILKTSFVIDDFTGDPEIVYIMQKNYIDGQIVMLKPVVDKTLTLKSGGNINISADVTVNDDSFVILQYYKKPFKEWDSTLTYTIGEGVNFRNIAYTCVTNTSAGESPSTATSKWVAFNGYFNVLSGGGSGGSGSYKAPVRVASTGNNITHPIWNENIDGVTVVEGDRILIKDQSTGADNGIYVMGAITLGTGTVTRASDFADSATTNIAGSLIPVNEGSVNLDTVWMCTTNDPLAVGTTPLVFSDITGGAGGGLNTNLSNMVSPTIPPVELNMNNFGIENTTEIEFLANPSNQLRITARDTTPTDGVFDRLEYHADDLGAHDFYVDVANTTIPRFGITETSLESNVNLNMNGSNIISETGSTTDSGFIRLNNDEIALSSRNSTDTGNFEIKMNGANVLDLTESANNPVGFQMRAQHATNSDATFYITQTSDTGGAGGVTDIDTVNSTIINHSVGGVGYLSLDSVDTQLKVLEDLRVINKNIILDDTDQDSGIGSTADDTLQFFTDGIIRFAIEDTLTTAGTDVLQTRVTTQPIYYFYRNQTSPVPAIDDVAGEIFFDGNDSGLNRTTYAKMRVIEKTVVDGNETGQIRFDVLHDPSGGVGASSLSTYLTLDGNAELITFGNDVSMGNFNIGSVDNLTFQTGAGDALGSAEVGFSSTTGGGLVTNILNTQTYTLTEEGTTWFQFDGNTQLATYNDLALILNEVSSGDQISLTTVGGNTINSTIDLVMQRAGADVFTFTSTGIDFATGKDIRTCGGIAFTQGIGNNIQDDVNGLRFSVIPTDDFTWTDGTTEFGTWDVNELRVNSGGVVKATIDNTGLNLNDIYILVQDIATPSAPSLSSQAQIFFNQATNRLSFQRRNDGDTAWITVDLEAGTGGEVFTWTNNHNASDFDLLQVDNITSGANNVHNWDISRDATLADDTEIGAIRWRSNDGAGAPVVNDYAYIRGRMEDDVDTNEDGSLFLGVAFAGNHATNFITLNDAGTGEIDILRNVDFNAVTLDNAGIIRSSASDTADTGFIQMGNGEIISWEANPTGDDGLLTFNSLNRFQFSDHPLVPSTNGGTSLGNSGLRWNTVWATNGDITNLLSSTIGASNTLSAPVVSSGLSYTDGIKQTFNPNATNAGINVGSHTADPSSPSAGDIYYDSTNHKFRIATGASPTWGDLGGGGEVFTWTNHHDADGYNFLISQSGLSRIFGDRDAAIPAGEIWFQVDNGASGSNTILVMDHGASEVRIGTGYNLNPTSSGTQQLGIDSDRWDSVWVDSYIDMDDSGTPTNAGSGEGRLYWNNTTKSFHQVDDVGTTTDLSSASAGANQQLSNLSGTVAVNQSIQSDTNITDSLGTSSIGWLQTWSSQLNFVAGSGTPVGNYGSGLVGTVVKHNVPTGGSWQFDIQGSNKVLLNNSKMEFKSLDLDMNNNEIDDINFIRFMGSSGDVSFGKIGVVSGATDWLELIGDSTSSGVRIKATNATPTESTVAEFLSGQLDMLGNNIVDVSILNFEAVTGGDEPQIYSITDDLVLQVTTGDTHRLNVGGTDEYTFDASTADWNSNEITDMGGINFASVGTPQASAPEIVSQSDDLYFGVPTGNKFIFEVNQSSEYEFSSTFFYLRDNYMRLDELGSAPPANANAVKIWCEDNGSGKTRLMCRFGTGASQQIAIEP